MATKGTIVDCIAHVRSNGQHRCYSGGKYNTNIELEAQIHRLVDSWSKRTTSIKESNANRFIRFYESMYGSSATMERYVSFVQWDPENSKTKIRLIIPGESISVLLDIMEKRAFSIERHPNIRFERKIVLGTEDSIDEFPVDAVSIKLSKEEYPDLSKEGIENLRLFVDEIVSPTKTRPVIFKIVNRRKYEVSPGISVYISQEFKSDRSIDDVSLQINTVSASKSLPLYSVEVEMTDYEQIPEKTTEYVQAQIFQEVYRAIAILRGDQISRRPSLFREDLAFLSGPLFRWRDMFAAVRTLSRGDLVKMKTGDKDIAYAVSPKADGVTAAVVVNPFGIVYLYDVVSESIVVTNMILPEVIGGSILEGEYIREQNKVYVYDILVHNTRDVRDETYFSRVSIIDKVFGHIGKPAFHAEMYGDPFRLEKKDIFVPGKESSDTDVIALNSETFARVRDMMRENAYPFETDGVIFTGDVPYPKSKGTKRRVNAANIFKYKPVSANTVDFLIRYEKNASGLAVIETIDSVEYRRISFFVYKGTKGNLRTEAVRVYSDIFPVNSRGFYVSSAGNEISDDSIVECQYSPDLKSWTIMRMREDKTDRYRIVGLRPRTANAVTTYESTISVIEDPILLEELEQAPAYYAVSKTNLGKTISRVHNSIKRVLIDTAIGYIDDFEGRITDSSETREAPWVIDFSVGQGGDLRKYSGAGYVFAMDIDPGNITTAKSRAESMRLRDVAFVVGDSTKSIKTLAAFKNPQKALFAYTRDDDFALKRATPGLYDIGVLNFTLSHFFESPKTLDGFLKNASDVLKIDGLLVITTIDGQEVAKLLDGSRDPLDSDSGYWSFWDEDGVLDKAKSTKFARKYKYRIKSISTEYYEEFATDIPVFVKRAKKFGLVPATDVLENPIGAFDSLDPGLITDLPDDVRDYVSRVERLETSKSSDERFFSMHKYIVLKRV